MKFDLISGLTIANELKHERAMAAPIVRGVVGDFGPSLTDLLGHEGGNDDDKRDPGGRTSRGIIQSEYDKYRREKGLPMRDVWKADQSEVLDIYRRKYWQVLRCDDLPAGIDYCVFDYGVNSGVDRAAKVLQRLLNVSIDGKIGDDETLPAARKADAAALINAICDERMAFLKGLHHWPTYGRGWTTRVKDVRALSLKMAAEAPAEAPKPAAKPAGKNPLWALLEAFLSLFVRKGTPAAPRPTPDARFALGDDLASRIIKAMLKQGYRVDSGPGEVNIVQIEGLNLDGTPNDNKPNQFNDPRFCITFEGKAPKIVGKWEGTCEPSYFWTKNPMNAKGAARIKFGQWTAWRPGDYHGEPSFLQVRDITVCRDLNQDFKRDGDEEDTGMFGILLHAGYDLPHDDLGRSSAGCLVIRFVSDHREFMRIAKSDPRAKDPKFIWTVTVMPAADIV